MIHCAESRGIVYKCSHNRMRRIVLVEPMVKVGPKNIGAEDISMVRCSELRLRGRVG
jgi:hypothetical protein